MNSPMHMAVTDDSAAWVTLDRGLGRYADGRWTRLGKETVNWYFSAVPGNRVCGTVFDWKTTGGRLDEIVCYDATGHSTVLDTAGLDVTDDLPIVSIAPDGAIWVSGRVVSRLSETAPAG
jgi:hypothetical protein